MSARLWYPQLDVYDTARRMIQLIGFCEGDFLSIERLYIADFFLATPSLLHTASYKADQRKSLSKLKIPKPHKSFVSLPHPGTLYHNMGAIQVQAFQTIVGKALINLDYFKSDQLIRISDGGIELNNSLTENKFSKSEKILSEFIVNNLVSSKINDITTLRKNTGLKRIL